MRLCKSEIIQSAMTAGFYLADGVYGQDSLQLMPTSDYSTLEHFAKLIIEAYENKLGQKERKK